MRTMGAGWRRILAETALIVALAAGAWHYPFVGQGGMKALFASLLVFLWMGLSFLGRRLPWSCLGILLALVIGFSWVAHTVETKGGQPYSIALLAASLFYLYESLGLLGVVAAARWVHRRSRSPWASGCTAGFVLLLWEIHGFHVYQWGWGPTLSGLPWLARGAAFLTTYGMSALFWGLAAGTASLLALGRPWRTVLLPPLAGVLLLLGLSGAWYLLPRDPERILDVVMVQPNFEPGARMPGMEEEMWARSDRVLKDRLPRPGVATLLLWPESAVLGRNDLLPNPRLAEEARRRGIAWLYGSEGGEPGWRYLLYNLVRGEAAGLPSFVQAKTIPMPFGERMPGPPWLQERLDRTLGFLSGMPGRLSPESCFVVPTPQGPLRIHPLICSEALIATRVQEGVALAGAELMTNHTNDGWFEKSAATDLHALQIRLRAVEMGLPLIRCTLTGKSGLFREDGTWALWGASMSEATHAFTLRWRPVRTPARSPWVQRGLLLVLGLAAGVLWARSAIT